MIGIRIKDGFMDLAETRFKCPQCNRAYDDQEGKYLDRCNKNKSGTTKYTCQCGHKFSITFNYMGDVVVIK